MRTHTLATAIMLVSSTAAAGPSSWLTIGDSAYTQLKRSGYRMTLRANQAGQLDNIYLIQIATHDLPSIAATLHRQRRQCGGFMFHASEQQARLALANAALRPAPLGARPSYVIANQSRVTPVLAQMDEQHIGSTIIALSGFLNRYYSSAHGADASVWLHSSWRDIAASRSDITVAQFEHASYGQRSVIATIAGSDKAAEVIVVGAHLDSINLGLNRAKAVAPGADDDASGVAGLTEVLRGLVASDYRPRRSIKLIAYAAEEVGLRGSQDIARQFKQDKVDVVGVLQLDMTNFKGSSNDIYLISDYTDTDQNRFIETLISTYLPSLTVGSDQCGYACSDHAAWNALGYITSMPFEAQLGQDNPHIHSRDDTYANSGSQATHALKFARLAAAYVVELGSDSP